MPRVLLLVVVLLLRFEVLYSLALVVLVPVLFLDKVYIVVLLFQVIEQHLVVLLQQVVVVVVWHVLVLA